MRRRSLDEPSSERLRDRRGAVVSAELRVDVLEVGLDGGGTEDEGLGYLEARAAVRGHLQNLALARGEPGSVGSGEPSSGPGRGVFAGCSPRRGLRRSSIQSGEQSI